MHHGPTTQRPTVLPVFVPGPSSTTTPSSSQKSTTAVPVPSSQPPWHRQLFVYKNVMSKPQLERRRRERINKSLQHMKRMLLEKTTNNERQQRAKSNHIWGMKPAKWEKADILEMLVELLQETGIPSTSFSQNQQCNRGGSSSSSSECEEHELMLATAAVDPRCSPASSSLPPPRSLHFHSPPSFLTPNLFFPFHFPTHPSFLAHFHQCSQHLHVPVARPPSSTSPPPTKIWRPF